MTTCFLMLPEERSARAFTRRTALSLHSQNYDLELVPPMQMIERFCLAGFGFHEPEAGVGRKGRERGH
jgi:hypothetical protein